MTEWAIRKYREIPDSDFTSEVVRGAFLSRVESGRVYWPAPNPARGFLRGAAYDHRGFLIDISQRQGGAAGDMIISTNPPVLMPREKAEARDNALPGRWLYAGNWMHAFGHFLVETIPTLWPLLDSKELFDGVAAHRFNSMKTHDWQFELVRLLTDEPVRVVMDIPVMVEELVVPTRAYHYQQAFHPAAAEVWDRLSENAASVDDPDGEPVYLSRSRFEKANMAKGIKTGREYANSEEVDGLFASRGFRVVYPETLSVMEQIRLARSAPLLAGPGGSALHLAAFAKPGARVLELGDIRTKGQMVNTQQAISAAKRQEAAMIPYFGDEAGALDLCEVRDRLAVLGV